MRTKSVVREIDTSCLSAQDQATLLAAHGDLRGTAKQLDGCMTKVRFRLMCSNALLTPDAIRKELVMIQALAKAGVEALDEAEKKLAS